MNERKHGNDMPARVGEVTDVPPEQLSMRQRYILRLLVDVAVDVISDLYH